MYKKSIISTSPKIFTLNTRKNERNFIHQSSFTSKNSTSRNSHSSYPKGNQKSTQNSSKKEDVEYQMRGYIIYKNFTTLKYVPVLAAICFNK